MIQFLAVAAGGAIGAVLRYGSGLALTSVLGSAFPYATLFVNGAGSFIMGYVAFKFAASAGAGLHVSGDPFKLFVMTGILGGFTTFSAFSLDFFKLLGNNQIAPAVFYVFASLALSLGALMLGAKLAL